MSNISPQKLSRKYRLKNIKIKDVMRKRHEPKKKEKERKTMGTLMPAKKRKNNGCKDTRQRE
jgi:hypothetical protein